MRTNEFKENVATLRQMIKEDHPASEQFTMRTSKGRKLHRDALQAIRSNLADRLDDADDAERAKITSLRKTCRLLLEQIEAREEQ